MLPAYISVGRDRVPESRMMLLLRLEDRPGRPWGIKDPEA